MTTQANGTSTTTSKLINVTTKIDTHHVIKLKDDNYELWKYQVLLILRASKLWNYVSGALPRPAATASNDDKLAWEDKDYQAQAIIVPTLDPRNAIHVYNCATSKDIFDTLQLIHSDSSALNKQRTLNAFFNIKHKPGSKLVDTYLEVEKLARHLKELGVPMEPVAVVTKIVSSLPPQHNEFKRAWDSVVPAQQTMPRLRKEEIDSGLDTRTQEKADNARAFSAQNKPGKSKTFQTKREKAGKVAKIL